MKSTPWLEVVSGLRAWWRPLLWYVRMKAANGQNVMSSKTYVKHSNAVRAAHELAKQLSLEVREHEEIL